MELHSKESTFYYFAVVRESFCVYKKLEWKGKFEILYQHAPVSPNTPVFFLFESKIAHWYIQPLNAPCPHPRRVQSPSPHLTHTQ